jgi:hypothetical protein
MNDDKAPLQLTLVAAGLLAAAVLTLQPYSAEWPGNGYSGPAERYVRAALAQDSVALARLSATDSSVAWGLATARRHPASLAAWARHSQAFMGERHGDTTQVFVYSADGPCGDSPIHFRFVHARTGDRVVGASLACLDSAAP